MKISQEWVKQNTNLLKSFFKKYYAAQYRVISEDYPDFSFILHNGNIAAIWELRETNPLTKNTFIIVYEKDIYQFDNFQDRPTTKTLEEYVREYRINFITESNTP